MKDVADLQSKIAQCRRLRLSCDDDATIELLTKLTRHYEAQVAQAEARGRAPEARHQSAT
jgi:hypothetical protein